MHLGRWAGYLGQGVAVYNWPGQGCWKMLHLPTQAREPKEEKPYKVRQGLITVVVVNSYWVGEWGS